MDGNKQGDEEGDMTYVGSRGERNSKWEKEKTPTISR
jgi:hypothetical protein